MFTYMLPTINAFFNGKEELNVQDVQDLNSQPNIAKVGDQNQTMIEA
jgi:hypothetical protein